MRGLRVLLVASFFGLASLLVPTGQAPARASAYELDTSFGGGDGFVDFGDGGADWHERPVDLIVLDDGSVHLPGTSRFEGDTGAGINFLVHLSASGVPDPAYGPEGEHRLGGAFVEGGADGSFVVLHSPSSGQVLTRYHRPGVVDTAFGTAGSVPVNFAKTAAGRAPFVRSRGTHGGWWAVGTKIGSDLDWLITRATAAGAPDETFGPGGTVQTHFGFDLPRDAVVQPDGKLVVTGSSGTARYTDGGLDPTWSEGGRSIAKAANGWYLSGESVILQPDGKVVVAGSVVETSAEPRQTNIALARFLPDGSADPTFGAGGLVETQLGGWDNGYGVAAAPDGRLLVAGRSYDPGSTNERGVLLRYRPDGTLDSSFGTGGVVTAPFARSASLSTVAVDGDHIYVGGVSGSEWVVARYGPAPKPSTSTTMTSTSPTNTSSSTTTTTTTRKSTTPTAPTSTTTTTVPDLSKVGPDEPVNTARRSGYWMVGAGGTVYRFGDAGWHGNAPVGSAQAVDIEPSPSGDGYWVVESTGKVHAFGDAPWFGNVDASRLRTGERATSLSARKPHPGYLVFTSQGRVFEFGPHGRSERPGVGHLALNGPVLDSVVTPSGNGYYMVASDGGIFTFGDAVFRGSMGGHKLNAPVQSLVPDADADGYWLVASDGGIFAFRADFKGSMGAIRLNRPVTGMVRAGTGYLMVAEDGGIFDFSGDPSSFKGSLGASPPERPITSVALL
jgi:uncharacterized delta-60 repeat protein